MMTPPKSILSLQEEVIEEFSAFIIALLIRVISGHTPKEIVDTDLHFIDAIGLKDHLSPTRSNGLLSMVKQIKAYAVAYSQV